LGVLAGIFPGLVVGAYFTAPAHSKPKPAESRAAVAKGPRLIIQAENGVETYLNSNLVGSSYPLTLDLAANRVNQVRLSRAGFKDYELPVRLTVNESMVLAMPAMEPLKSPPPEPADEP
jgi:hypothetical protein